MPSLEPTTTRELHDYEIILEESDPTKIARIRRFLEGERRGHFNTQPFSLEVLRRNGPASYGIALRDITLGKTSVEGLFSRIDGIGEYTVTEISRDPGVLQQELRGTMSLLEEARTKAATEATKRIELEELLNDSDTENKRLRNSFQQLTTELASAVHIPIAPTVAAMSDPAQREQYSHQVLQAIRERVKAEERTRTELGSIVERQRSVIDDKTRAVTELTVKVTSLTREVDNLVTRTAAYERVATENDSLTLGKELLELRVVELEKLESTIRDRNKTIEHQRQELHRLDLERKSYLQRVTDLQLQLEGTRSAGDYDQLVQENDRLSQKIEEHAKDLTHKKRVIRDLEKERDRLSVTAGNVVSKSELEAYQQRAYDALKLVSSALGMEDPSRDIFDTPAALNSHLSSLTTALTERTASLAAEQRAEYETKITELESSLSDLTEKYARLSDKKNWEFEEKLREQDQKYVKDLKAAVGNNVYVIADARITNGEYPEAIKLLNGQIRNTQKMLQEHHDALEKVAKLSEELTRTGKVRDETAQLRDEIRQLEADGRTYEQRISTLTDEDNIRVQEYQKSQQLLEAERDRLLAEVTQLKEKLTDYHTLEQQLEHAQENIPATATSEELFVLGFKRNSSITLIGADAKYQTIASSDISSLEILARGELAYVFQQLDRSEIGRAARKRAAEITSITELTTLLKTSAEAPEFEQFSLEYHRDFLRAQAVLKSYRKAKEATLESELREEAENTVSEYSSNKLLYNQSTQRAKEMLVTVQNLKREYNKAEGIAGNIFAEIKGTIPGEIICLAYGVEERTYYRISYLVLPEFESLESPLCLQVVRNMRDALLPYGRKESPVTLSDYHGSLRIDVNLASRDTISKNPIEALTPVIEKHFHQSLLHHLGLNIKIIPIGEVATNDH